LTEWGKKYYDKKLELKPHTQPQKRRNTRTKNTLGTKWGRGTKGVPVKKKGGTFRKLKSKRKDFFRTHGK